MNFFAKGRIGRRRPFFRPLMPPSPLERLRRRYAKFVKSEFVSAEKADADFYAICVLPNVRRVAIKEADGALYLVADIGRVILADPVTESRRDIGDMLIVLRRHPDPEVRFYNQTRVLRGGYHHPHVWGEGTICSQNVEPLLQELAAGNVARALRLAIAAAHSYGPGNPVCKIENWPLAQTKGKIHA